MAKKFAEHNGLNLTQVNNDILEMWREKNVFWRSVDEREGCPQFVFFEGPPSANGHPGIHHVLARTIKDTFNRYKTMKGYQVKRKAGWDTHGLPVELGVEKELGITKADIVDNEELKIKNLEAGKKAITIEMTQQIIDRFMRNTVKELSVEYIINVVCGYFNISIEQLALKTRKHQIVEARQIAMYLSKKYSSASLNAIGQQCGKKDHATVYHACKTVSDRLETDRQFKTMLAEIEKKITL